MEKTYLNKKVNQFQTKKAKITTKLHSDLIQTAKIHIQ